MELDRAAAAALGIPPDAVSRALARRRDGRTVFEERRSILRGIWSETTHAIQSLRDDMTAR